MEKNIQNSNFISLVSVISPLFIVIILEGEKKSETFYKVDNNKISRSDYPIP